MKNLILLNDNTEVKLGDTGTKIRFKATNNGTLVALKDGQSATFRIKNDIGFLKSINADTIYNGYGFEFDTSSLSDLVAGAYQVELAVTQTSDDVLIFPDKGYVQFKITDNALSITGEQLPQMSLEAFKNEVNNYVSTKVKEASTELTNNFQTYVDGITDSTTAVANKASQDAATAISTANSATATADSANATSAAASTLASGASAMANQALMQKVGARNLLRQTATLPSTLYNGIGTSQGEFMGATYYEQHATWKGLLFNVKDLYDRNLINTFDDYVFSFYVKVDDNSKALSDFSYFSDANSVCSNSKDIAMAWKEQSKLSVKNEWVHVWVPLKFASNSLSQSTFIGMWFSTAYTLGNVYWACPKLEKGTRPSDYMPAPEDYDLSTAQQQIGTLTMQIAKTNVTSVVSGAVDFDGITTNGKYSFADNSATNAPADVGTVTGILEVTAGGGNGVQRFFDTSADLMFWRTWSGSTFHSWKVAANDSSIITPASD